MYDYFHYVVGPTTCIMHQIVGFTSQAIHFMLHNSLVHKKIVDLNKSIPLSLSLSLSLPLLLSLSTLMYSS